ncbi:acyl-CoA synthetase, partial [Butyricicoccus sp. 1XD8-22]
MKLDIKLEMDSIIKRARRNTLGDLLERTKDRYPTKVAIRYEEKQLTYKELDEQVNKSANAFHEAGIKKGDMISILSKNSLDFIIVNFALARIGAVMIPLNYMLTVKDIAYILDHAGVTGLITSVEYAPVIDEAAKGLDIKYRYLMEVEK